MISASTFPHSIWLFVSTLMISLCLGLGLLTKAEGRTYYVDSQNGSTNGGTSWTDAVGFTTAIRSATDGDTIWVKKGKYSPDHLEIEKQLDLYGGFSGNESPCDPEHRDWWKNQTVFKDVDLHTTAPIMIDGFFIEDSYIGLITGATTTLVNCVFDGNARGGNRGGAITHDPEQDPLTLINCLIVDNDYTIYNDIYTPIVFYMAIFLQYEAPLTLIHCTIADNEVVGHAEYDAISPSRNLTIKNSIIRDWISPPSGTANVTYSNIIGGFEGEGNIDANPKFGSQYKLLPDSPCIDTGTASEVLYDIRNVSRPIDIPGVGFDGSVAFDMGAFEFRTSDIPVPTNTPKPTRTPTETSTPTVTLTPTETSTPTITPTIKSPADINGDGDVDAADLLILLRDWGRPVQR